MTIKSEIKSRRHDNPFIDPSTGHQYNIFWHEELTGTQRSEAFRLFATQAVWHDGLFVLLPPEDWIVPAK